MDPGHPREGTQLGEETELPRINPDIPRPQRSKRAEALLNLAGYFERFFDQNGIAFLGDVELVTEKMAIDTYKIVKRAEGFDV